MNGFENAKRIVIKVGTSSLTYPTGMVNIRQMENLCRVLADLKNAGKEVILVSSGAVAVGTAKLGLKERPRSIRGKQAAAAVGQCELMYIYDKHFTEYHHKVAQVLLTRDIIEDPKRKENVQNTFECLLEMGAIPIVNENDTVSTDEIEFGDNDTLSAIVASVTHADGLILMSDIDGLYDGNPQQNPNAKLIPVVHEIDAHIEAVAGGSGSEHGTGGMATKISAAKIAFAHGCVMAIINSADVTNIYSLLEGGQVGTVFRKGE